MTLILTSWLLVLSAKTYQVYGTFLSGTRLGDFPQPDFSKTITLYNEGYRSFAEVFHNFSKVPFHVRVYAYTDDANNENYMFEGVGACQNDGVFSPTGGIIYAYNTKSIRIWTPVNGGSVVFIPNGWGENKYLQNSSQGFVRVEAWKDGPSPAYEKEIQIHSGRKHVITLEHPLLQIPELISVRVGATKKSKYGDFYYNAIGASSHTVSTRLYGGVMFGYNEKKIVLWTPNKSKTGCIYVGKKWGNGKYYNPPIDNCTIHIRLWTNSLPTPTFQTDWQLYQINTGQSFFEITHNLKHLPSYVKLQYRFPKQVQSLIFEASGTVQSGLDNTNHYGGVLFAYSTTKLRMWLPSSNTSVNSSIIYVGNGWGVVNNPILSNSAEIRIQIYTDRCFEKHEIMDALGQCRNVNETRLTQEMTKWGECSNPCGKGDRDRKVQDCTGNSLQPVIDCQFNNGFCGFTSEGFQWVITSGVPPQEASHLLQIPSQGPNIGSLFIYTNTSQATPGKYGILKSPDLTKVEGCILRFKYSTESYFGMLRVDVVTVNKKLKKDIWHMFDFQVMKGVWRAGYINIGRQVGAIRSFQFVHQLKHSDNGNYDCPTACNPVSLTDIILECDQRDFYVLSQKECKRKEITKTSCLMNVFQPYQKGSAWSIQNIQNIKKEDLGQFVHAIGNPGELIASYQFFVQRAGKYQVWLDAFAVTNTTNGIIIQISDSAKISRDLAYTREQALWLPITFSFQLQAGTYFLYLYQKEKSFNYKNIMIVPIDIQVWSDLGMQNRFIPDSSFEALGGKSDNLAYSRLNGLGVWMPTDRNRGSLYLEIQLPELALINKIATQGGKWLDSSQSNRWYCTTDSYKIKFSLDGQNFAYYRNDSSSAPYLFAGNNDFPEDEIVEHELAYAYAARAARFYPEVFLVSGCLRIELYGYYIPPSMCPFLETKVQKEDCQGDGICQWVNAKCEFNESTNSSECACINNYHGKTCQLLGCESNPCLNQGTCLGDDKTFKCMCKPGFKGKYCDIPCPRGVFGADCVQKCNCPEDEYCNPKSGSCSCLPGFYGMNCDQPCQNNTYGQNCENVCLCDHYQECDHATGYCQCPPGYYGETCEQPCEEGKYGKDCNHFCFCENNGTCIATTGHCDCPEGWIGEKCENPCPQNRYGKYCSHLCQNMVNARCDPINGFPICKPGFTGSHCQEECEGNKYGEDCKFNCLCDKVNTVKCDSKNGKCECKPGYNSEICDRQCKDSWGINCKYKCLCQNGATCDVVTGACWCPPGFIGRHCEERCQTSYYGNNCSRKCECVTKNTDECQPTDGRCRCKPGYQGSICNDKCEKNFWGRNCAESCKCLNNGVCDHRDGFCYCPDGYQGQFCENVCNEGKYGRNCESLCQCKNNAECDSVDGHCECNPGYWGSFCELICSNWTYGLHCKKNCECIKDNTNLCSPSNGKCHCRPGYMGQRCEQVCDDGYYGSHCISQCRCYHSTVPCLKANGTCVCASGFVGAACELDCDLSHYGIGCTRQCQCTTDELCNNINGGCFNKEAFTFVINLLVSHGVLITIESKTLFVKNFQHIAYNCFDNFTKLFQNATNQNVSTFGHCRISERRDINDLTLSVEPGKYIVRIIDSKRKYTIDKAPIISYKLVFMHEFEPINGSIMETFLMYVGEENLSTELYGDIYKGRIINSLPSKAWHETHLKYIGIAAGILFIVLLLIIVRCTRKATSPSQFQKIKNTSSKETELPIFTDQDSHLLAFENPYYDVIAAMGLDDDIEEDYYNPLYDNLLDVHTDSDTETDDMYYNHYHHQRNHYRSHQYRYDKDSGFSSGTLM